MSAPRLNVPELPARWPLVRAQFLFIERKITAKPDDEIVTAFRDGQVTKRSNRRTEGFTNAIKEIGYQRVRKGDLVIHAMDAFAGAIGVSDSDGKCSPVYGVCHPNHLADARFYAHHLRTLAHSGFIASLSKGIRERSTDFRYSEFRNLHLPVPPLPVQRAIADFLDRKTAAIDELIHKKERLIELLQEKRQALITQAVTKGLDPNVPMKDSGIEWLGEIPAHWEVKRLKHISPKQHGRLIVSPNKYIEDDGVPIVFGFNIRHGKIDLATIRYIGLQHEERFRNCTVAAGDLLCVRVGAPGETAVVPPELDGCHFASTMQIVQHSSFHSPWLAHAFNSHIVRQQIGSVQYGAAQEQINVGDAVNFVIPTPPLDEQHAITSSLDAGLARVSRIRNAIAEQIDRLREYRQSLISAAVTGQLPIPTDPAHAE